MTMLERVKAKPLPEPNPDWSAFSTVYSQPQLLSDREQNAAEADAVIAKLCQALEGLLYEAHTASSGLHQQSEWSRLARAALAEARKA